MNKTIIYLKRKIWILITSKISSYFVCKLFVKNGFLKTQYGKIYVGKQPNRSTTLLFFGIYEQEDLKFVNKYITPDLPVVEFGASLGVITSSINQKLGKTNKIISVEANPTLYDYLSKTKEANAFNNLEIISAAVDYSGDEFVCFAVNEQSLSSHKGNGLNSVQVPVITLNYIVKKNSLKNFLLVCDIEGAELQLFLEEKDKATIDGCRLIIIELHETSYQGISYSESQIADIIVDNFNVKLIDKDKTTYVFSK